jgi:chromosome partitioning protein
MITVALLSQKGGALKTTLSISLACAGVEAGKETLLIDLDPQATACKWGDRRQAEAPIVIDAQPARLANALQKAKEGGIQLAVIDTPPRSADAALAAAKLADVIVLPCRPQMYDLETIPNTLELVATARSGKGALPMMAVLTAVPAQGSRHEQAKQAIEGLGVAVCPQTIGQRAAFGDAGALGMSVLELDGKSRASEEVRQVYLEIMRLVGNGAPSPSAKPEMSEATKPEGSKHAKAKVPA